MDRDAFLQRVGQAARQGRAYRVSTQPVLPRTGYLGVADDLCEAMARQVELAGGTAVLVPNADAARDWLESTLDKHAAKSALCWQHATLDHIGLTEILASKEITRLDFGTLQSLTQPEQRKRMLAADIGISSADYAIAETGTLLVCSKSGHERVASLLPPIHIGVVRRNQIVPDLIDAFDEIQNASSTNLPSNITLITGPSKTGDIELQLTTGVHGPGTWYVLIVQE